MSPIKPHIFRAYDIRGIAMPKNDTPTGSTGSNSATTHDIDLTPLSSYIIGIATGEYLTENFGPHQKIIVGRDNRLTGESLQKAFIHGLEESKCIVTNIGLATSPMVYWGTCALPFDAGINITASHNPKEYNGIKIVGKGAHSICGDELQKILAMSQAIYEEKTAAIAIATADSASTNQQNIYAEPTNTLPEQSIAQEYLEDLLHRAHPSKGAPWGTLQRPLKIVIDAGNATAGAFAPTLFRKFGCEVIELYCDLDGNYPHHEANPEEAKNMQDLGNKVRETGAACGIAFDGDGDRTGIVDEKGRHHSADYLLLLLAKDLLKRMPESQIVFDVKVSQLLISGIREANGVPVMSKTGHSFIESKMKEIKSPLGGEISGHFFFGENYYGFDDAFLAALRLLSIFSQSDKPVSQHFDELPKMSTTPEFKLRCPDDKKFEIVQKITDHFTKLYPCITLDGVRVNFDTSSWGAIRCSNTSPNLTARLEAPTNERLAAITKIFIEELKKYPEIDTRSLGEVLSDPVL